MIFKPITHLKNWWHGFPRQPVAQTSPLQLDRRHVFIVPTRAGLFFLLLLVIMLLGAINYNNSMAYALTFLLGSMSLISSLHTQRNLLNLRIETGKVAPVFVGDTAQFQLWLDNRGQGARFAIVWQTESLFKFFGNPGKSRTLPLTALTTTDQSTATLSPKDLPFAIDIPTNQRISIQIPVAATQRGRLALERITIYTTFPLSLFVAWSYIHLDLTTLVYPRPAGQHRLPCGHQTDNSGEGRPYSGGSEDFIGYRHYQLGDSPRHVDWKAVAREQPWLIKQFGGLSVTNVWLTWEEVSMCNHVETALSQLCLWILIADRQGALYGLKLPHITIEPNIGESHREHCLQTLALF